MKVTADITKTQLLKVAALMNATEEQTVAILLAAEKTPEIDVTEYLKDGDNDYQSMLLVFASVGVAALAEKEGSK